MDFDIPDFLSKEFEKCRVKPDTRVKLKDIDTNYRGDELNKDSAQVLLEKSREMMSEFQDKLIAHDEYSVLIVLQAMDAAGKDGVIKNIMSGLNPAGVKVASFKTPSSNELDHDYFWRHYLALPARGQIGIFNRSHYENVLVTRVHPEYILRENLPEVQTLKDINDKFWQDRFKQINRFEKNLHENGTLILKFFLNISKKEQKERFLSRIDDPKKNWKFSAADVKERQFWNEYRTAYEDALSNTSTPHAPWFIIPSDQKWWGRLLIATIICYEFDKLHFSYPKATKEQMEELIKAKEQLLSEGD